MSISDDMRSPDEMAAPNRPNHDDDDVIVIRKSWLITAIVALAAFALGGLTSFLMFNYAYNKGADDLAADLKQQLAASGGQQVAAAQPTQPPARLDNVSVDDDPFLGPEDAPITIVEFSDFQCPYCAQFEEQTFNALLDKYKDKVRFVYRDFPLTSIHPDAMGAALAANCANEQDKFWQMHDAMFSSQRVTGVGTDAVTKMATDLQLDMDQFDDCVQKQKYSSEISHDMADGTSYGVTGTPTFFINGVRLVGAQPIEQFSAVIEQLLAQN
jgi:protein-disulfide isomerase